MSPLLRTLFLGFSMLTLSVVVAARVAAGPNAGGTLIIHVYEDIGSRDGQPVCDTAGTGLQPSACFDADTEYQTTEFGVWGVFAAFAPGSSPRVAGLIFGIQYDESTVFLNDAGSCADFELPSGEWPSSGAGTAITWSSPLLETFTRVYAFAGYEYYGTTTSFDLIPHPNGGGYFGDDDVPANLDQIAGYGRLGFNGDPGALPCPTPVGACCLSGGECIVATLAECDQFGGDYIGDAVPCDPSPCPTPAVETSWGGVKSIYEERPAPQSP